MEAASMEWMKQRPRHELRLSLGLGLADCRVVVRIGLQAETRVEDNVQPACIIRWGAGRAPRGPARRYAPLVLGVIGIRVRVRVEVSRLM